MELDNHPLCPLCAGYVLQINIIVKDIRCFSCGKYGISYIGKRKIIVENNRKKVEECPLCLCKMKKDFLDIHKEYYCTFSEKCIKVVCQICKDIVNLTTFQTHYEQHISR